MLFNQVKVVVYHGLNIMHSLLQHIQALLNFAIRQFGSVTQFFKYNPKLMPFHPPTSWRRENNCRIVWFSNIEEMVHCFEFSLGFVVHVLEVDYI